MKIEQFEDILAWQKAKFLTLRIYALLNNLKDYGFRDQICRAAISVMNNIAEGFERRSDN
jgi:four helix bundle protein